MPDVTASYGMPLDFINLFLRILHTNDEHSCLECCIFTKTFINCVFNHLM